MLNASKRVEVETCVQSLNNDMIACLDKGEANHDMTMYLKPSTFRKAIAEKKSDNECFRSRHKKLEEELKKK